jgi:uncharacterized LabA/DUF88 family protein
MEGVLMIELIPYTCDLARAMIFVDGENLAIRYGNMLKQQKRARPDIVYAPNVFVWSKSLNPKQNTPAVMRKYYYTAVQGDHPTINDIEKQLKNVGIETPRVYKKNRDKGSKQVDITLATDMLLHATRKHYDVAVLVAGDEDYVPLVKAVQGEGARVVVWFISNGISPALYMAADFYVNLDEFLFEVE